MAKPWKTLPLHQTDPSNIQSCPTIFSTVDGAISAFANFGLLSPTWTASNLKVYNETKTETLSYSPYQKTQHCVLTRAAKNNLMFLSNFCGWEICCKCKF